MVVVGGWGGGGLKNRFARAGDGAFSRERGHARRVACGWDASRDVCGGGARGGGARDGSAGSLFTEG